MQNKNTQKSTGIASNASLYFLSKIGLFDLTALIQCSTTKVKDIIGISWDLAKTEEGGSVERVGEMVDVPYKASSTSKDILAMALGMTSCNINVDTWLKERNIKITLRKDFGFTLAGSSPVSKIKFPRHFYLRPWNQ